MRILIVAAMDENRLIGNDGRLPWPFLPNDHAHVQRLVKGRKTIMGRKSYDTPDRIWSDAGNIVMTSQLNYRVDPGFEVVHSMEEAFDRYKDEDEVVVLGGAQIYAETIPRASVLYLTLIHGTYEGDAYFPDFLGFELTAQEDHPADDRHAVAYSFQTWERG
ncbi:dihydrofolate reductase [Siphonobacter aquaeclarae]|uniref:dihydrofolate reductase n=1 Tax=Siphonobacter aquaeclarae TaxID=563176 RepID=A0A1G9MZF4_9BACT|nr:dihydrofolate reductase [Siphonobacter aquaeclarae]SDL79504.1 dihydrofolate reductase [Siphonobacter aquaeclarae]